MASSPSPDSSNAAPDGNNRPTEPGDLSDEGIGSNAGLQISRQMREFLLERGISLHKQASHVSTRLGCSNPSARRKLLGESPFSEDEIEALVSPFGYQWRGMHGGLVATGIAPDALSHEVRHATLRTSGALAGPCVVTLVTPRRTVAPGARALALVEIDGESLVLMSDEAQLLGRPVMAIQSIQITPKYENSGPRVAVLDDDLLASRTTAITMNGQGFRSEGFTDEFKLREAIEKQPFDAYILDWQLNGKRTSNELIMHIRRSDPNAVLVVLSGRLGDTAIETEVRDSVPSSVYVMAKPCMAITIARTINTAILERSRVGNGPSHTAPAPL